LCGKRATPYRIFLLNQNQKNMQSLKDKVALITGAGKGIGKAVALALAQEGVLVGLVARTEKDVKAVAEQVVALGVKAAFATADVSNRAEVEAAVAKLQHDLGPVDILINNAGTATFGKFLELEPEVWEQQVKVNVFGVYYTTRAVLPQMIERKTGDIINISSTAGKSGSAVTSAYSASKFAVFGLSESLMQEVRKHNIRVTALAPSTVVTDLANSANLVTGDAERVMHPEDFAELIIAQLKLHRRIFVKEASIFSTNP
jgi:3-oxoacyl-[acyl-carrier protein] reductase